MLDRAIENFGRRLVRGDEGFVPKAYKDTKGNWTALVGLNLNQNVPERVGIAAMDEYIKITKEELHDNLPFFDSLDPVRQWVFIDMVYNMGIGKFMGFHKMIHLAAGGAWQRASEELMNSQAARDLPVRYKRLKMMLATGQWPDNLPSFASIT